MNDITFRYTYVFVISDLGMKYRNSYLYIINNNDNSNYQKKVLSYKCLS